MLDLLVVRDGLREAEDTFDVEHLGAVYEGLLGFEVQTARGRSLTLLPDDVVVDVDALAALDGPARLDHLAAEAGLALRGRTARAVTAARGAPELLAALAARASPREPEAIPAGGLFLQPTKERRRFGAHYTSPAITRIVVERTLAPLLREARAPEEILALRICDPAMGSGAFLVEACRQLAARLVEAWQRSTTMPALPAGEEPLLHARRLVAKRCLYGVDRSALAVDLARASLWLVTTARDEPLSFADHALCHGDSLVGLSRDQVAGVTLRGKGSPAVLATLAALRDHHVPFHWEVELSDVFAGGRGGFDAIVGNPPWVSYAGRAAQPLAAELRDLYATTSPAFHGYRNLQGVFVHRAATLLRPGGRLGLVLPTSMSDLGGYEPSRRAHDTLCLCDDELPDFGNGAFEGVFQPAMGLLSTRRPAPVVVAEAGPWPLQRKDLDPETAALLDHLGALPRLPPQLFGERGFQSTGDDARQFSRLAEPTGAFTTALRVGGNVEPFLCRRAQLYCDREQLGGRFRAEADWRGVKLLIRQTARYPMVALSDGQAFRNSILAGFSDGEHSEHLLLAYLNSAPIRWFHYQRHRDARQGMPQLKIAHLRALPAPPRGSTALAPLQRIGRELGERNSGISAAEQETIDGLVADALGLGAGARTHIAAWATATRG